MDIQNVKDAIAAVIAAQQDANAISKDGKAARDTAADSLRKAASGFFKSFLILLERE